MNMGLDLRPCSLESYFCDNLIQNVNVEEPKNRISANNCFSSIIEPFLKISYKQYSASQTSITQNICRIPSKIH